MIFPQCPMAAETLFDSPRGTVPIFSTVPEAVREKGTAVHWR
jgi:hypothetical protein